MIALAAYVWRSALATTPTLCRQEQLAAQVEAWVPVKRHAWRT